MIRHGHPSLTRLLRRIVAAVAVTLPLVIVANIPTTTRVGIDYRISERTVPLYQKVIAFLDRDIQMRWISDVAVGDGSDEDRCLRLLRWTTENIRPQPAGLPVVDDHPFHIVVRGYGTADQAADVFATLAAYKGIPATLVFVRRADGAAVHAVAYARVDGTWRVFDVRGGFPLRDGAGRIATVERLRQDPASQDKIAPPAGSGVASYAEIVSLLPDPPEDLRSYDQMPLTRLWKAVTTVFRR